MSAHDSDNGRDRDLGHLRLVQQIAHGMRAKQPTLQELPHDPTAAELAQAYASLASRYANDHTRIADALEALVAAKLFETRARVQQGVPWWVVAILSCVIACAVVAMAVRG